MSRTLSTSAWSAIAAQQTSDGAVILLTIMNSADSSVIDRLTDNSQDVVSRGNTFMAYPFALELPADENGQPSRARLSIDNVSRQIIDDLRSLPDPLQLLIEIVFLSDPDTVEVSYQDFVLRDVSYDALTISGTLTLEDFTSEPFPKDIMSAVSFPGQF